MANIHDVSRIINAIANGIEDECLNCMDEYSNVIADCICEQLSCGVDGSGAYLSPTYDSDPYFNEEGRWKGKSDAYKRWKQRITPPVPSSFLSLSSRPAEVPNLFIRGVFYDSIFAVRNDDKIIISTRGFRDGPQIEKKYGDDIFFMGESAKDVFNTMFLRPWIENFIEKCGYK